MIEMGVIAEHVTILNINWWYLYHSYSSQTIGYGIEGGGDNEDWYDNSFGSINPWLLLCMTTQACIIVNLGTWDFNTLKGPMLRTHSMGASQVLEDAVNQLSLIPFTRSMACIPFLKLQVFPWEASIPIVTTMVEEDKTTRTIIMKVVRLHWLVGTMTSTKTFSFKLLFQMVDVSLLDMLGPSIICRP